MKLKLFLPLAAFVALAAVLGVGLQLNPREVPSPFIDKPAPAFSLPRLHQPEQSLAAADLKGQVWLLNVWASWCVACRVEHPVMVEMAKQKAVPIYGLNYKDDRRNALEWLRQFGDPYTASLSDRDGRVGIDYGVYGVPETFVIDKAGIVRHKHIGPVTQEVWDTELMPLVRKLQG
ncbi:DsbE family thiol:disulfide interchange protein [Hydrogenophaga sp. RWCD_12]|uniref:DsbE family thiol:disulfide interchange protein n=1 Tax=Hydrogenophaga sp. RWCD_12 TaxID=3391190 RepID=UPI003984DC66